MAFHAKPQKGYLGTLLFIPVIQIANSFATHSYGGLFYFSILLGLFIIITFSINYTFNFLDEYLMYEVSFKSICIYKRVLYPSHLKKIAFKRYSWATPGALIHTKKGLNLRLVLFSSNKIFYELLTFANKHDIPISKTKDYLLLERRSKYTSKEKIL
ncbi:hypothetical protein OR571_09920 [Psychrobacillus sp. NEAU-3TGS]|uniref:hypothetical protein n=1 Tax=Psychrobacillus sp. NEAU-3TGS TaxID=2995412 RepID=UPI002497781A|nr:hypothetical protein [Psychrobacillus sp. NEAU-3TGS]MDI2587411.1 hypothetical protein [Psychrobacillus sp. NEAU-3TGS]